MNEKDDIFVKKTKMPFQANYRKSFNNLKYSVDMKQIIPYKDLLSHTRTHNAVNPANQTQIIHTCRCQHFERLNHV